MVSSAKSRIFILCIFLTLLTINLAHAQPQGGGLIMDNEDALDGYLMIAPLRSDQVYLIDDDGALVHSWQLPATTGQEVHLLENSNIIYTTTLIVEPFGGLGASIGGGGHLEEMTWEGEVVWSYDYADESVMQHHDIRRLPNGNILIVAWEHITNDVALTVGMNPELLPEAGAIWPDHVVELDPRTNQIVWLWRTWDHLVQDYDPNLPNYGVIADHPQRININYIGQRIGSDWQHINSVNYNAELDQILLSVRNLNEVWIIDHSTTTAEAAGSSGGRSGMGGDILYRWGNPAAYERGSESDRQLFLGHDAGWIADGLQGAGNILLFNNGDFDNRRFYSTVTEITPPLDDDGTYTLGDNAYAPATPAWSYRSDPPINLYSRYVSSVERLPNGNTLILEGTNGRIIVVTPDGDIVWEYISPYIGGMVDVPPFSSNAMFRVGYYPPDYEGLAGLN